MDGLVNKGRIALLNTLIEAAKKNPDLAKTLYLALKLANEAKR